MLVLCFMHPIFLEEISFETYMYLLNNSKCPNIVNFLVGRYIIFLINSQYIVNMLSGIFQIKSNIKQSNTSSGFKYVHQSNECFNQFFFLYKLQLNKVLEFAYTMTELNEI